jgi:hypothetical protein
MVLVKVKVVFKKDVADFAILKNFRRRQSSLKGPTPHTSVVTMDVNFTKDH